MNVFRNFRWIAIAAVAFALPRFAFSWDDVGHEVIAAIAWTQLTHQAKLDIARILTVKEIVSSGDGEAIEFFVTPSSNIDDDYLEQDVRPVFIRAATWADAIKPGRSSQFDAMINRVNLRLPDLGSISNGERNRLKSLHYINLPLSHDKRRHGYPRSNAVLGINLALKNLSSEQSRRTPNPSNEALWLYLLEHIVGDLHQPLHCCTSYSSGRSDAGGNRFQLAHRSLHGLWDDGIDMAIRTDSRIRPDVGAAAEQWVQDKDDLPTTQKASDLDPMRWANEGRSIAEVDVYTIDEGSDPPQSYLDREALVSKRQALLAGFRLAALLNRLFK